MTNAQGEPVLPQMPNVHSYTAHVNAGFQTAWTLHASCSGSACQGRQAVIFVHGYTVMGDLGGGEGTWAELPRLMQEELEAGNFASYIFRYRSNSRFQDVAKDLSDAVDFIYNETGRKVHIVAHSFGGVVARAYLQGLAGGAAIDPPTGQCSDSRHPKVASLMTAGSPHSGIYDGSGTQAWGIVFPNGRDDMGRLINECGQLSCWQAGATMQNFYNQNDYTQYYGAYAALRNFYGIGDYPGEIIAALSDFSSHPLPVPTLALIGLESEWWSGSDRTKRGDGLISYQGQRFSPHQSCSGGSCQGSRAMSSAVTSINGQALGSCLYERVLASGTLQSVPGEVLRPTAMLTDYVHSSSIGSVPDGKGYGVAGYEVQVTRSLLPGVDAEQPHLGSVHDTFNRARAWLLMRQAEPIERNVELLVSGRGRIAAYALDGSNAIMCVPDTFSANNLKKCLLQLPLNIRKIAVEALPEAGETVASFTPCEDRAGNTCHIEIGGYERVEVKFSASGYTPVHVTVSGPGEVTGNGQRCANSGSGSVSCVFSYSHHATVALEQRAAPNGQWNGWSGACSGLGTCAFQATLGGQHHVTASFRTAPAVTRRLNDTGITWSGHATDGNAATCNAAHPAGQDCHYGRDALAAAGQLTKIGGGNAGFDFTKISNSGNVLPPSATLGSGPNDWACTRDNVTGLIWEVKTTSGLRSQSHGYTWYNPASPDGNPGDQGDTSSCGNTLGGQFCNTHTYVQAVNAGNGLCGASNWRMPSVKELV